MNSLRLKIAATMTLLVLVATATVGVVSYRSTSRRLIDEVDRSISQATAVVARSGSNERFRLPARGVLGVYSVRLVDRTGETVSSSFDRDDPLSARAALVIGVAGDLDQSTVTLEGERFRVHTIGRPNGAIQIGRPLGETDRVLRDVRTRTAWLVLIVSALAAAAGWLLASSVAAPLRRLTRAANDIGASGDLDVALPASGGDEVGQLGVAFGSMLGALSRSRGEQQRLVQDAGHELRTPLTSLRTNLAVLRRHPDMDEAMRGRVVEDLESEATELTDLVNELVAVASGDLADQPADDVDLEALLAMVAARVERRRNRPIVVVADDAGSVRAPLAGLERAVANLLENSAKFDSSGGEIRIEAVRGRVTVYDRGPGIAHADLPLVFERFHRATTARTMPGSGLGLAIVREVVERHGGSVHAENRSDGGAAVGFELPLIEVSPDS